MKPIIGLLLLSMFSIALVHSRSQEQAKVMKLMDDINRERRHVSPGSANMREVQWSDCLSSVAANYLRKCNAVGSSNEERNTQAAAAGCESFDMTLGETIFHAPTVGSYDPVRIWSMQSRNYNFYENQCAEAVMCDDYLQVANAAVSSVGCAHIYESTCGEEGRTGETYVCYYAPAADNGRPYKQGESCNDCGDLQGCNNGLCVEEEVTKPTLHTTHTHRTRPNWIPTFPHIVTLPPQPSIPEGSNKNIDTNDNQPEIPQGPKNDQEGPHAHGPSGHNGPKHSDGHGLGPSGNNGAKHGHGHEHEGPKHAHGPAGNHGVKHDGPAGHDGPKHAHGPAGKNGVKHDGPSGHDGPKHGHGHEHEGPKHAHGPAGNHGVKHGNQNGDNAHGHQTEGKMHGHMNGDRAHGAEGGAHEHGPMHGDNTHGPHNGANGHGPQDGHRPMNGPNGGNGYEYLDWGYGPSYYYPSYLNGDFTGGHTHDHLNGDGTIVFIDGTDGHDHWNRETPNHPKPTPSHQNGDTHNHIGNGRI